MERIKLRVTIDLKAWEAEYCPHSFCLAGIGSLFNLHENLVMKISMAVLLM